MCCSGEAEWTAMRTVEFAERHVDMGGAESEREGASSWLRGAAFLSGPF